MKTKNIAKEWEETRTGVEVDELDLEKAIAKPILAVGAIVAGLAGLWGFACLIGAVAQSGGVGELIQGFITAVGG